MECSHRVAHVNDAKTMRYDGNQAVTVPLWETQNAGSCQGQASMLLSASACKILTFLLDEDAHRRLLYSLCGNHAS